jgi:hypothetical protein
LKDCSSSQIFWASRADLPLAASGPVSAMPKPMRIGSSALALAVAARPMMAAANAQPKPRTATRILAVMTLPPESRREILVELPKPNLKSVWTEGPTVSCCSAVSTRAPVVEPHNATPVGHLASLMKRQCEQ